MPNPEQLVQYAFDFENPPQYPPARFDSSPALLAALGVIQDEYSRFVRPVKETVTVRSPVDAAIYLMENVYTPFESCDQEELWVLLLNTQNRITHDVMLYRGGVNTVYVRMGELFKEAVRVNAPSIILSHLHPSGSPEPSPEDVRVTQGAVQAGKLLGIDVLDHIIVGEGVWTSLKEKGLGFE